MRPADIALTLRRRSPWEAMDLGLAMLQRWRRVVYGPHLAVGGTIAAAAFALAFALERPWLALFLLWWMKPVIDRAVLHVLSRAVFGERQGVRAVLGAWRDWLASGLPWALTLGRFDTARSFNLAVRQLEGQRRAAGRARRGVLGRRVHGYGVWLTVVCLVFEVGVLYWSLHALASLFVPAKSAEAREFWDLLASGDAWTYGDALAYTAAVLVLEPFYVAAGFALYLNRRSVLEGWDIEVALRRIAQRHSGAAAGVLLAVFLSFLTLPMPSYAQKDPRSEIAEVLKAPEFPHEREVMQWRARNPEPQSAADLGWLEALGYALANAARVALWIAAAAAIVYALWWAARLLPRAAAPPRTAYRAPATLFGMELAPETLPPDVAAAAAALAAQGRLREALGLLYRGALSELVHRRGVMLLASHTEVEVLGLSPQESKPFLARLVEAWRLSAYAGRDPARAEVDRLALGYREFAP